MRLNGHYQNAYVTNDVDWAKARMRERFGLEDWLEFEVEFPVETPVGERMQGTKVAAGWAGALQYELIQPLSGYTDPFLPYLPADPDDKSLRFHHVSLRRESMAEIDAEIAKIGAPLACRGGIPDLTYTYVDTRDLLGHYLEFVWASEAGWQMVGWPEGLVLR